VHDGVGASPSPRKVSGLRGAATTAELAVGLLCSSSPMSHPANSALGAHRDWRTPLPTLTGSLVVVRELQHEDADSLQEALVVPEVVGASQLVAPIGARPGGFARFIAAARQDRAAGLRLCFGIVPRGCDLAIGIIEIRAMEPGFHRAEWRAAIAPEFWGSGVFGDGARLVLNFLFGTIGARRLEARASVSNLRANAALLKIGAIREAMLRASRSPGGRPSDQILWTILADDWRSDPRERVH
jgi:RimJ/RimL family protein N-acetyltransferase